MAGYFEDEFYFTSFWKGWTSYSWNLEFLENYFWLIVVAFMEEFGRWVFWTLLWRDGGLFGEAAAFVNLMFTFEYCSSTFRLSYRYSSVLIICYFRPLFVFYLTYLMLDARGRCPWFDYWVVSILSLNIIYLFCYDVIWFWIFHVLQF